jgi:hypothetical protein
MPTTTRYSGLRERTSLRAYSGACSAGFRSDLRVGQLVIEFGQRCQLLWRTAHNPDWFSAPFHRHFSPGAKAEMSASTAAPAALAFSEGRKELTNGTTAATPPTAPAQPDAINQVRLLASLRLLSAIASLMEILEDKDHNTLTAFDCIRATCSQMTANPQPLPGRINICRKTDIELDTDHLYSALLFQFVETKVMGMMSEFKEFAVKGNVMDLAVGVIIGGAFGKIVDSVVGDLIMPVVGAVFGKLDFSNLFVVLGSNTSRNWSDPGRPEEGRRSGLCLWKLHYGCSQLCNPGIHHFHDGQADQSPEERSPGGTCTRACATP